ncbi:hypothetical protein BaRGS_00020883 [Batillaria attramentaria]|uniref:Uncharacterized protein n=1 Tax=Batillaria attramentaria TaxID=370345 RepID=A0ABD0KLG8_9CAEN
MALVPDDGSNRSRARSDGAILFSARHMKPDEIKVTFTDNPDGVASPLLDQERGTEKYHGSEQPSAKPGHYGVAWYKQDYPETTLEDAPPDTLAQDVSSTAVLTPLDDDLVGEPQEPDDRAFLFPFILMLLLVGFPLMFMELSFGQFAALGPAAIFERICPLFYGLGYGMIAVSAMVSLYYTVLIGWAFLYMFRSFAAELPWERCHGDWATPKCYSYKEADECMTTNGSVYYQNTCYNATMADSMGIVELAKNKSTRAPPAQDFFEVSMLGMSDGIEDIGSIRWQVALCLLLAWTLTFLALSKGVKSVGKGFFDLKWLNKFALLETVMTAVQDTFPHLRQKKTWVVLFVCIGGFLGGLVVCTQGGMYVLQLMDTYAASWSVFLMAICECAIIGWIYGADNFIRDIEMMIGLRGVHWKRFFTLFWKFLTPATLLFLLFFNWIQYTRMSYAGKLYPVWAEIIGWVMAVIPVVLILSLSVYKFFTSIGDSRNQTIIGKLRFLLKASPKWGPAHKLPRFDLSEVTSDPNGKTVTNPGFAGSSQNPFETRI